MSVPEARGRPADETISPESKGPLAGLRVLEMGQLVAGPFCGQILGDFGAEVIKLEEPVRGDPMRAWGHEKVDDESLWWPILARNKKSVTCNLRTPEGQDLARRLATISDVVVENFRPGTLESWGLGYERLSENNPGLILVRVTGFGQSGPYAPRAGYGSIGEAMGGLRYITGNPGMPPTRTGLSIGDSLAGTFAAVGALVALHERSSTGLGQVVDAAIYESVLAMMESLVPEFAIAGYTRERTGPILPNVAPSNVYPTKDAEMILVAANQDTVFQRLAMVMGMPDLADDVRFSTHAARGTNQEELDQIISAWTHNVNADELISRLSEAGIPVGRVYRASDMLVDPHFEARQSIIQIPSETFGDFPMQNVFPRLSRTPGTVRSVGPALGAHDEEILRGLLELDEVELRELRRKGVLKASEPENKAPSGPPDGP